MPFSVRPATLADAPTIAEYNRRLAVETEGKTLDASVLAKGVAAILADRAKGRYFVADRAGEVIGQMMITYEWSDWRNGWIWWLQSVYVRADCRRGGVFRALFAEVIAEAKRERDVVAVRLYVEEENTTAQATYRSLGFEEMHFLLMGKSL
jgi:ribosomal protein S18 acetylase RimI-like enzyme